MAPQPALLPGAAAPGAGAPPTQRARWSSRTLLAGHREVEIEHDSVIYRLQLTSLGKLILTK
jgi:hemin uptake protein HemP